MFSKGTRVQRHNNHNYAGAGKKLSFRQRLRNWLMNDNGVQDIISIEPSSEFGSNPFRLHIYRANGGTIVETRFYNRKNNEDEYRLHIITDDKDLGQEIGKLITMDCLRGY